MTSSKERVCAHQLLRSGRVDGTGLHDRDVLLRVLALNVPVARLHRGGDQTTHGARLVCKMGEANLFVFHENYKLVQKRLYSNISGLNKRSTHLETRLIQAALQSTYPRQSWPLVQWARHPRARVAPARASPPVSPQSPPCARSSRGGTENIVLLD